MFFKFVPSNKSMGGFLEVERAPEPRSTAPERQESPRNAPARACQVSEPLFVAGMDGVVKLPVRVVSENGCGAGGCGACSSRSSADFGCAC